MLTIDTSRPIDRTGCTYCGPLVVAGILGTSTGVVADTVRTLREQRHPAMVTPKGRARRTGAKGITGTYLSELSAVLERAGYKLEPVAVPGAGYKPRYRVRMYVNDSFTRMSRGHAPILSAEVWHPVTFLARLLPPLWRVLSTHLDDGTYVVNTPGHWALLSGGRWTETFTGGAWVPKRGAPKQSRKVCNIWRVVT